MLLESLALLRGDYFQGKRADAGPAHPCCVSYLPPGRKTMPTEIRALFWWVLVPNFVSI